MILLKCLPILMLALMLTWVAIPFLQAGKSLLSRPFLVITFCSTLLTLSLYRITGSAPLLEHYQLEKSIQALGGMEAIIHAIEKRVAEHPEDKRGREILDKIRKSSLPENNRRSA